MENFKELTSAQVDDMLQEQIQNSTKKWADLKKKGKVYTITGHKTVETSVGRVWLYHS